MLFRDGYPSGGNYWSNYHSTDFFFGNWQNLSGSDGIGDKPYSIDANNFDHYPLTSPFEYWSSPISGDVDRDTRVTMGDIVQTCDGFGSVNGTDGYYWHKFLGQPCPLCPHCPNCDIDRNGRVDMGDINVVLDNFGKHNP